MEERNPDIPQVVNLPVHKIKPNAWNPNTQSDAVFNALVENIAEVGMLEPILVVPSPDAEDEYIVISGEHRLEACKVLGYTEVPAIVKEDFDEDMQKFQTVRMNVLKGKMDPVRFTKLFDEMAAKYGEEMTKQLMAFVDEKAFKDVYMGIKKELPKDMQKKLDEAKDEIRTVDDLSRILNELFSRYGDTLDNNWMIFSYGGKTHLWVLMDAELKKRLIDEITEEFRTYRLDAAEFFKRILENADMVIEAMKAEGPKPVEEDDIEF